MNGMMNAGNNDDSDNDYEWMLGEAQLYIHAGSTALVMLLTPTSEVRERAVNVAGETVG